MTKTQQDTVDKTEQSSQWANRAKVLAPLIVSILGLILGTGFVWNELINIPKLTYSFLPTYEVGGQNFGGLVIENRGRTTAHDVIIKVSDLGVTIDTLRMETNEIAVLQNGGEGEQNATVLLDRMVSGSTLTIYMLTSQSVSLDNHVTVIAEEGRGYSVQAGSRGSEPTLYFAAAIIAFLVIAGGAFLVLNLSTYYTDHLSELRRLKETTNTAVEYGKLIRLGAARLRVLRTRRKIENAARAEHLRQTLSAIDESPFSAEAKLELAREVLQTHFLNSEGEATETYLDDAN